VALAYHRRHGRHGDVHIRWRRLRPHTVRPQPSTYVHIPATGAVSGRGVEHSDVEPPVVEHLDIEHFDVEHLVVTHFDVEHFDVGHRNLWQALLRARLRGRSEPVPHSDVLHRWRAASRPLRDLTGEPVPQRVVAKSDTATCAARRSVKGARV